ncbi:hypothetical protein [Halobacillus karajensis]|nr:hypothetical protein [Halobacillus karajensis]
MDEGSLLRPLRKRMGRSILEVTRNEGDDRMINIFELSLDIEERRPR